MTNHALQKLAWWVGVPFLLGMLIWGPYWGWSLYTHEANWLRIPIIAGVVFDVTAYLQSAGEAMHGLPAGSLLGPFTHLMRGLHNLFPSASVTEVWFISRWMCECLTVWLAAWVIGKMSGASVLRARAFSLAMWLSYIAVLGMKPAVFSWFLPGGIFGIGAVLMADRALARGQLVRALGWVLSGVVLSSSYAWYLIFVAVYGAVVWFCGCIQQAKKAAVFLGVSATVLASLSAVAFAYWVTYSPAGIVWLELYQRLSLSYTHLPYLSSTLLLTVLWVALLGSLIQTACIGRWRERAWLAFVGWVSLVLCFWLSPFTGFFILNDHFRAPAVLMSWFTLALIWEGYTQAAFTIPALQQRIVRCIPYLTSVVSAIYIIRILLAPYAWNGDFLNVLQLSHWIALGVASLLIVGSRRGWAPIRQKPFFATLFGCLTLLAGIALSAVYSREFSIRKNLAPLLPAIQWINQQTPVTDALCMDHGGEGYSLDDVVSAHTGRVVHMAHTTLYQRERDQAYLDRMRTIAGFYDVRGAGDEEYWRLQSSLNQFIICDNFPVQRKLFSALGLSSKQIDRFIGCPTDVIERRWNYVRQAIEQPKTDVNEFQRLCPWVLVPARTRAYWHLPSTYREITITPSLSLFSVRAQP